MEGSRNWGSFGPILCIFSTSTCSAGLHFLAAVRNVGTSLAHSAGVHMYVCMHAWMYACTHMFVYVCTNISMCVIHIYMHVCKLCTYTNVYIHVCMCMFICICICICPVLGICKCMYMCIASIISWYNIYVYIHEHIQIHVCVPVYICIYRYIHTYMHTYMLACIGTYIHVYMYTCIHSFMDSSRVCDSFGLTVETFCKTSVFHITASDAFLGGSRFAPPGDG